MSTENNDKKSTHNAGGRDVILRVSPEVAAEIEKHRIKHGFGKYEAAEDLIMRGAKRQLALSAYAQSLKEKRASKRAAKGAAP